MLIIIIFINYYKIYLKNKIKPSEKWIVMTSFNSPSPSLANLIKTIKNWKIIVISNTKNIKINNSWKSLIFTNNLVYLTLKEQLNLGYKITKYLEINAYSRKNIGYLYAIQHGAKEIYELDEDIIINDINDLNINLNKKTISYGITNVSKMINPYNHFGERNIWPRGFRIKDIGKDYNNKFFLINSNNLNLKFLIYQGLINGIPDLDSMYLQTKILNNSINITFQNIEPLMYLPGNYIPINSKNTKYLYELFPFLTLPTTINEKISDIFRGYIVQYFAWRFNGCVIYFKPKIYRDKYGYLLNSQFVEEKNLYYNIDKFLKDINIRDNNIYKNSIIEQYYKMINNLVEANFLGKNDLRVYKAYLEDLSNIGYNYSNKFTKNKNYYYYKEYIKTYSEFNNYIPQTMSIRLKKQNNQNIKIINHYIFSKKFKDILLVINYNREGFEKLNNYIMELYKNYFDNIVFITPSFINNKNLISCKRSHRGSFSYICFQKVYQKYPNYKGYLYINDDDFVKIWELNNLDFNIPWLYNFGQLPKTYPFYKLCINMTNILNNHTSWKQNLTKFLGNTYYLPVGIADFYYVPNYIAFRLCELFKVMFKSKIFLECAVPSSFGILLNKEYQLIYISALFGEDRKKAINFLIKDYRQITIHPIKFKNIFFEKEVNQYIYFINAKEY